MDTPPPKARAVEATPPDLLPVLAPLMAKIEALQAELAALRLGPASALPTYPSQVTKAALDAMTTDPQLPDPLRPTVALLAHTNTLMDDRSAQLTQEAYAALAPWLQQLPLPSPDNALNHRNAAALSPHAERFQLMGGRPYYRSAQGKLWDTTQAPPYPCRRCHCLHWNRTPCPQPPTSTSTPTAYYAPPYPPPQPNGHSHYAPRPYLPPVHTHPTPQAGPSTPAPQPPNVPGGPQGPTGQH